MKPLRDWTIQDVLDLKGRQENDILEVKSGLDGGEGRAGDPWLAGGKLSDNAKNDIAKEVIAFANHDGGLLLVGVDESKDEGDVDRIGDPKPIRACKELAKIIQDSLRDIVDPPLSGVFAQGIPMSADSDSGVVVVEVRSSPSAPHWNKRERKAYVRRGHRSDPMTMREIQDLTILRERGAVALEEAFGRAAREVDAIQLNEVGSWAIKVTAIPLARLNLPDIKEHQRAPHFRAFTLRNGVQSRLIDFPVYSPSVMARVRGICTTYAGENISARFSAYRDGQTDALVIYRPKLDRESVIYATWLLALFGSVLDQAARLRDAAGTSAGAPFAIEARVRAESARLIALDRNEAALISFGESQLLNVNQSLPQHGFGERATLPNVAHEFLSDIYDLAGRGDRPLGRIDALPNT